MIEDATPTLLRPEKAESDDRSFFKIPGSIDVDLRGGPEENQDVSDDAPTIGPTLTDVDDGSDIWTRHDVPTKTVAAHRTWEGFMDGHSMDANPRLLTEAGSEVYDSLLNWEIDPMGLNNAKVPVVEMKVYFSSLLALALGRESVLFLYNEDRTSFQSALPEMRVPGYSVDVLKGLEEFGLSNGLTFLQLRRFVQSTYTKHTSRCGVALASSLDETLRAVQEYVVTYSQHPRSLLQLQSTITGISSVLNPFKALISRLPRSFSDEQLITVVFERAFAAESGEVWLRSLMQMILQRISKPWIELLEEWIGTRREQGMPFSKTSLNESKGFVKVEAEMYVDHFGQEVQDINFRLDWERVPDFMPAEVVQTIFESGRNLRFIRESHPKHALARPDLIISAQPPAAEWLYAWGDVLKLEDRVVDYRKRLLEVVRQGNKMEPEESHGFPNLVASNPEPQLNFFGHDIQSIENRILASMVQLDTKPMAQAREDALSMPIRERLSGIRQPVVAESDTTPHWSLLPVLSFGSIVSTQAQIVNEETLRLLFQVHDLRNHLRLQRDYHLMGDGMFCNRLSHALFDPDLETAERRAGVARQGGIMGLRLGSRDTWPPASSELRLALMGVLNESYHARHAPEDGKTHSVAKDTSNLPGDLSFGVRDLSDEEIEKCMNPDSLEALDFLRLSYDTPDELRFIMTPVIMSQYDRVFKLLMRVMRTDYVVGQLWRDVHSRATTIEYDDVFYRFVREANHFVSSIAAYFIDTGITLPWNAFEQKLDDLEASLQRADGEPLGKLDSPEQLRELHASVLQAIMHSMFLRKRQEPVLKLLEDIFGLVLQYAKQARLYRLHRTQGHITTTNIYAKFKKRVQVFITVCKSLTEKTRSTRKAEDEALRQDGIGDESSVSQLLMKLDMFDYYPRH